MARQAWTTQNKARTTSASAGSLTFLGAFIALSLLSGCARTTNEAGPQGASEQVNDPAEAANRTIFAGNQWFDRNAHRPVARVYHEHVPSGVRRSLSNFGRNLREPGVLINDTLQGNFSRAWNTAQRFAVNTTAGAAGLFDVASDWSLPAHEADFGQTFGVWGIGPGPSVHLPLLGPSNLRDTVGTVVGFAANPLSSVPGNVVQTAQTIASGVGIVGRRAELLSTTDQLERNSLDYYAALRSISAQRRAALVAEGRAGSRPGIVEVLIPGTPTAQPRANTSPPRNY